MVVSSISSYREKFQFGSRIIDSYLFFTKLSYRLLNRAKLWSSVNQTNCFKTILKNKITFEYDTGVRSFEPALAVWSIPI